MNHLHSFVISMVIGTIFISCLAAETEIKDANGPKSCPTACQCNKEEMQCIGVKEDIISAMPKEIKNIVFEETLSCYQRMVKPLIEHANENNIEINGYCKIPGRDQEYSLDELMNNVV